MKSLQVDTHSTLHMDYTDNGVRHVLVDNVDEHLRKAKQDRDRSPEKLTYAAQDNQVLGTIPPSAIMELKKKGYDLLSPHCTQDTLNAAMRWLEANPMFKSTNKALGQMRAVI